MSIHTLLFRCWARTFFQCYAVCLYVCLSVQFCAVCHWNAFVKNRKDHPHTRSCSCNSGSSSSSSDMHITTIEDLGFWKLFQCYYYFMTSAGTAWISENKFPMKRDSRCHTQNQIPLHFGCILAMSEAHFAHIAWPFSSYKNIVFFLKYFLLPRFYAFT